jgi:hypothetical protein
VIVVDGFFMVAQRSDIPAHSADQVVHSGVASGARKAQLIFLEEETFDMPMRSGAHFTGFPYFPPMLHM